MERVRVAGLVLLGVVAVGLFLFAPVDGRFSQAPSLVLVAVLALIWHLACSDGGLRRTAAVSPRSDPPAAAESPAATAAAPRAGRSQLPAAVPGVDDDEDLSLLPDPPVDWPPPGVQVPLVFRSDHLDVEVIDLTDQRRDPSPVPAPSAIAPASTPATAVEDVEPASEDREPAVVGSSSGDDGEDPWLAFAAAMFRDD